MARIEMKDVAHAYRAAPASGADYALKPMNLIWEDGGAYALLGPSGCGKTTLLNIISGLLRPSTGQILFDGKDVTATTPQHRNIAQVFQFPVIYDTMTVFDNLAFPLRNRKVDETRVKQRVAEIADILELTPNLRQRASGLSADAKQKISLGRGLVRSDVAAVLFDEPLTVIDPHLKWLLRRKLKQIHQQLKLTLIYVTHDQTEALTFADQVLVMSEGSIVQNGTPAELFESPVHTFVGYFIGSPGMNFLPCAPHAGGLEVAGTVLPLDRATSARLAAAAGPLKLGIRPEFVQLAEPHAPGTILGVIELVQDTGTHRLVSARIGSHLLRAKLADTAFAAPGPAGFRVLGPNTCYYADEIMIARGGDT
jgi:glycerol transport system ATP-binding protein